MTLNAQNAANRDAPSLVDLLATPGPLLAGAQPSRVPV